MLLGAKLFENSARGEYCRAGQPECKNRFSSRRVAIDHPWLPRRPRFCTSKGTESKSAAIDVRQGAIPALRGRGSSKKHPATVRAEDSGKVLQGSRDVGKAIGGPLGYTPFEYVTFGDNQLTHELSIEVDSPVSILYAAWRAQQNYGEWLDIIGHTILHQDDERMTSYFMYYQWGHLPAIEVYTTMGVCLDEVNQELYLETVDGFPLAVCVLFEWLETNRTKLSLRVAYQMPANLDLYVGPAGVWGDVNDILQSGLYVMKERVEAGDAIFFFP